LVELLARSTFPTRILVNTAEMTEMSDALFLKVLELFERVATIKAGSTCVAKAKDNQSGFDVLLFSASVWHCTV